MLETLQAFVEAEMAESTGSAGIHFDEVSIRVHLCIPDDQQRFLPKRRRAPSLLPAKAPLPRIGEVVYLSKTSAWGVALVVHQWESDRQLRVEVWLEHVHAARLQRPPGFALTQ